ncbi:MAG: hypothetical protein WDZ51_08460 [Pirellulaceae bacterium]
MVKPTSTPLIGDPSIVAGGVPLPASLIATPPACDMPIPTDDLGKLLYGLIHIYPDAIPAELRGVDVGSLDEAAKQRFLREIQQNVGVTPMRDVTI